MVGVLASPSVTPATTTTQPTSASSSQPYVPPTTVVVPPYVASENARSSVTFSPCASVNGRYAFNGYVTNSKAVSRDFTVVVDFEFVATASVAAQRVLDIDDVAPNSQRSWSVTAGQGIAGLTCVVQFALAHNTP